MNKLLIEKVGFEATKYINKYVATDSISTLIVSTTDSFNLKAYHGHFSSIVNLSKVNNIRDINPFFEQVNQILPDQSFFIVRFETITARKERHRLGKIPIIKNIWFAFEFVFLRVIPKVWGLKKIYFLITGGRNHLLSKAEVMGRLVSTGFDIISEKTIDGLKYVVCKKVKEPDFNPNASYGPIFKMKRVGKEGKTIFVYKFRTMHPYAEYLQDYILRLNGYAETGKPKNDFRLTPWGKYLRRFWLDEFPQLINFIKGDLKLVGVRPVSERYLQDIPNEIKILRLKYKPGCIPPYLALNKKSDVESVLEAEKIYLLEKDKKPYSTDIKYFFMAFYAIIIKSRRGA